MIIIINKGLEAWKPEMVRLSLVHVGRENSLKIIAKGLDLPVDECRIKYMEG